MTVPTNHVMPPPARELLKDASLFLDLDGTLLELVDRPDEVLADQSLREMLAALAVRLDGKLAIVSGRSLEQLDAILGDIAHQFAVSGSHGCEHRWRGIWVRPDRPAILDRAAVLLGDFADARDGVLLEEKSYGVALHFRLNQTAAREAQALAMRLGEELGLAVQHGKMMVELRVAAGDKGVAVRGLMAGPPMAGTVPVFVGDDITDEAGFAAARNLGGCGILIGPPRDSSADYRLASPADLRCWLADCR